MATFTRPNGESADVPPGSKLRARPAFSWEIGGQSGSALFKPQLLVTEEIAAVGSALKADTPTFAVLTGIKNRPLWFDAAKSGDAEPPRPREAGSGVHAIVPVGGVRLRVLQNVAEAQAVIDAARAAV